MIMEKHTLGSPEGNSEEAKKDTARVHLLRHSKAGYKSYVEVLNSDNPDRPLDLTKQVIPDVPEAGVELAKKEAEKLFSQMDPAENALFFVSSSQSRAIETAKIYKDFAKEKGFTVISPEHHRNPLAERMDEKDIRVVNTLSLKPDSSLWSSLYNPPAYLSPINWGGVDGTTKAKWEEARKVVLSEDKGNWGANFAHYSDQLKENGLLPADQGTAKELFETQFPQILRLARFGAQKAKEGFEEKRIEIIAVGHENYLAKAFEEFFGEEGINNCEVVTVNIEDDATTITRRGKTADVTNQ